ncbi:hypothetical protein D3C81_1914360 [compost metagenome]
MRARAADFHEFVADGAQAGQVEFGLRVVPARLPRFLRGQDPVGSDHAVRVDLADHEVFAERVEAIVVDAVLGVGKDHAHVFREDVVTEALDLLDFFGRARQAYRQHLRGSARPRFCGSTARVDAC